MRQHTSPRRSRAPRAIIAIIIAALITAAGTAAAQAAATPRSVTVHAWHAPITVWAAPRTGHQPYCPRSERGHYRIWAYAAGGGAWISQCRPFGNGRSAWDYVAPLH